MGAGVYNQYGYSNAYQLNIKLHAKLLQSCLTLWQPCGLSPPGSSVHGIFQARILEWVSMPSSRESVQPRG